MLLSVEVSLAVSGVFVSLAVVVYSVLKELWIERPSKLKDQAILKEPQVVKVKRNLPESAWLGFSALAAHRIGNEISSVGRVLDILTEDIKADSSWEKKWGDTLPIMQECINRGKRMLIEQSSLIAEIKPDLKPTNLRGLIERAKSGILPEKAILNFKDSGPEVIVNVDPGLMEQAFKELCANAVEAGGNNVQIATEIHQQGELLCISFQDNGPGIRPEDAERIFEPHMSLGGKGTGLGLTTVRQIIEVHGGSIKVSPSRTGAEFIIKLPAKGNVT